MCCRSRRADPDPGPEWEKSGWNQWRGQCWKAAFSGANMPRKRKKPPPASLAAAHNPKAVGSNPAPATRKISVFDVKVAVFLVFLSDLFLCPLKKFNFNSTSQKIQAFFKNTSARIAGRDACPTQKGGHSPQPGVSALPSPGASIALFHAHHAYPHCGQMWLKFIPLLPFALESALWAALALGIC